jgi:hypothetical protein
MGRTAASRVGWAEAPRSAQRGSLGVLRRKPTINGGQNRARAALTTNGLSAILPTLHFTVRCCFYGERFVKRAAVM